MLYAPSTHIPSPTIRIITGRNLAHGRRSVLERAFLGADLHLDRTQLIEPTIKQCARLVGVCPLCRGCGRHRRRSGCTPRCAERSRAAACNGQARRDAGGTLHPRHAREAYRRRPGVRPPEVFFQDWAARQRNSGRALRSLDPRRDCRRCRYHRRRFRLGQDDCAAHLRKTGRPRKCGRPVCLEEQTVSKPTFILMLQPLNDGVDEIKALRFVLKRLLRQYGLRCVTLREVHEAEQNPRVDIPPSMRRAG
jgi:hypothetical protein